MGIKIVSLIHTGIRIGPSDEDVKRAAESYSGLLGMEQDAGRPEIPGIPGFWINTRDGDRSQQIHVLGAEGASPVARSAKEDPTRTHIAFTVEDLDDARAALKAGGVRFWVYEGLVGRGSDQVFFEDPFGNVIELQQAPS